MRRSDIRFVAVAVAAAALALTACSSSAKSTADTTPPTDAPTTNAVTTTAPTPTPSSGTNANATIKIATTSLGDTVVDSSGMTLYQFENDTTPGESSCNAGCDTIWPPVTVTGAATAGTGVEGAIATITRADGKKQVTLAGHPLYTFSSDKAAGDIMGQGFGGIWYATGPDGAKLGDES